MNDWHSKVYNKKKRDKLPDNWQEIRLAVFKKTKGKCQRCDKRTRLKKDGATAHHLLPRVEGGSDDLSNLVWLCSTCHDYVESAGLRSLAEIQGSFDNGIEDVKILPENKHGESFERPAWHAWVYGGQRNPAKDGNNVGRI